MFISHGILQQFPARKGSSPYGPELISQGDFDSSTAWSLGTGTLVTDGSASFNQPSGFATLLSQNSLGLEANTTYLVEFDIIESAADGVNTSLGDFGADFINAKTVQRYSQEFTTGGSISVDWFRFYTGSTGTEGMKVDNVSVRKVL